MKAKEFLVSRLKDTLIFAAWIGGLVLAGGLCWFMTRSVRNDFLLDSINRALVRMEDPRRLEAPVNPENLNFGGVPGPLSRQGSWFSLAGEDRRALFFTLIADGVFFPCMAIVSPQGKVEELIPLNSRGEKTLSRVPPGIIKLYIRRIEGEP